MNYQILQVFCLSFKMHMQKQFVLLHYLSAPSLHWDADNHEYKCNSLRICTTNDSLFWWGNLKNFVIIHAFLIFHISLKKYTQPYINLHCSAKNKKLMINLPALSQSQSSNFLWHTIKQVVWMMNCLYASKRIIHLCQVHPYIAVQDIIVYLDMTRHTKKLA